MYIIEHRIVSRGYLRDWKTSAEFEYKNEALKYLSDSERMFPEIEWRIVYDEDG